MSGENKKKVRSANYSEEEKIILFNLVKKYKDIIENVKSDSQTIDEKNIAWTKIASEFNSVSPSLIFRSQNSLKMFYKNKKHDVRSKVTENKKEIYLTGGGPFKEIDISATDEILLSIMDKSTVYGTENKFDSDSNWSSQKKIIKEAKKEATYEVYFMSDNEVSEEEEHLFAEDEDIEIPDDIKNANKGCSQVANISKDKNWGKYCGKDLKACPSSPLLRKNEFTKVAATTAASKRQPKRLNASRRRPNTVVRALTSPDLAKKYDILMEKRLEIAELTKQSLLLDIEAKKRNKKEENERP